MPSRKNATGASLVMGTLQSCYLVLASKTSGRYSKLQFRGEHSPHFQQKKKDADEWLENHTVFGDALLDEFTQEKEPEAKHFSVGGFAYVPRP